MTADDKAVRRRKPDEPYDERLPEREPFDRHVPSGPLLDSEVDFDDESDEDQLPLDEVEAMEAGVNLDDPERLEAD